MFDRYLIELEGRPAGIVFREGPLFTLHTLDPAFRGLDGSQFAHPQQAERALRRHRRSEDRRAA